MITPLNGDPFVGMLETPVTSSPLVAGYLSNLPAYRIGVSPLLRGVEIGLAHGFFIPGPFIKLGPLRNAADNVPEIAGCMSGAGLVIILAACLSIYAGATFQAKGEAVGVKTLSGREVARDPLQSLDGWNNFASGWLVGGLVRPTRCSRRLGTGFLLLITNYSSLFTKPLSQSLLGRCRLGLHHDSDPALLLVSQRTERLLNLGKCRLRCPEIRTP